MIVSKCIILLAYCLSTICCWDTEDLEIFDLVEEVDSNFYSVLGVAQDANATEIRKAYRRLSLLIHPDKNDAPDAEIKFRQLVAVYDVLRDSNKRTRYDQVLENGLPDWRHAVYYYRRVRKMGLAEMSLILFVIVTIGQYLVAWAAYFEKKYTAEQLLEARLKKLQKKQKKGKYDGPALPDSIVIELPSPRVWDTLPFQLPRMLWFVLTLCPRSVRLFKEYIAQKKWRKEEDNVETDEEEEEVVEAENIPRGPRRRKTKFSLPEMTEVSDTPVITQSIKPEESVEYEEIISGGLWTDDDLAELARQVKRFPPGTPNRWERVAAAMHRPTSEVTHMAKKIKEDGYKPPQQGLIVEELPKKVKTRAEERTSVTSEWSQLQQKALENALIRYPKSGTLDRWEKISKSVPGKTKEECMSRYKQLVELVKKKKECSDSHLDSQNEDQSTI